MKRKISIVILSVMLACLLSGCQSEIKDMKARQGFWINSDEIEYGGSVYKKLPSGNANSDYLTVEGRGDYIFVTDQDVPVLLSQRYGSYFSISYNGFFLYRSIYSYDERKDFGNMDIYCIAEKYDAAISHLNEGYKPDGYCYTFYIYDEKYRPSIQTIDLTDAQIKALETIRSGQPFESGDNLFFIHKANINSCTSDKLMTKSEYSITMSDGKYYVVNNNSDGTETSFAVPDEYQNVVKQIMQPVIENDMITYDMYDE